VSTLKLTGALAEDRSCF